MCVPAQGRGENDRFLKVQFQPESEPSREHPRPSPGAGSTAIVLVGEEGRDASKISPHRSLHDRAAMARHLCAHSRLLLHRRSAPPTPVPKRWQERGDAHPPHCGFRLRWVRDGLLSHYGDRIRTPTDRDVGDAKQRVQLAARKPPRRDIHPQGLDVFPGVERTGR